LIFDQAKPLGTKGLYWLKVHLCNLFGNNKISLQERYLWSLSNSENIIESALKPIEGSRWWTSAEEVCLYTIIVFIHFICYSSALSSPCYLY
jgi:DNA-directed RNA polymerase